MQLHACLVSALLLAVSVAAHYQVGHHGGQHPHPHPKKVFPFLSWIRDSAVGFIFGKAKSADVVSYPGLQAKSYTNEVVIRFNVTETDEEEALAKAADRLFLDVWAFTPEYVDIRLHKDDVPSLMGLLPESLRADYFPLISDLASAVWETYPSKKSSRIGQSRVERNANTLGGRATDGTDNLFFQDYQPLPVVTQWMRLLEAMFPSLVHIVTIGKSYEGRDILGLRVGEVVKHKATTAKARKTLVVTGGVHAREWISTTTVNYLAWSFITSYNKEPMITKFLQNFDIVFVPALNPDGIEYTWEVDRLWRKSRQHTNLRFCRGLDLDHAFSYKWDSVKHQTDPCSESYGGDEPFQAVEALQLAQWAKNETGNNVHFVGLLDLHSYSQQVLFPFSYSCSVDPPNLENLQELAAGIAKAIRLSNGQAYSIASACEGATAQDHSNFGPQPRIESGGGSAIDWFYHELKARYSYQIKLRDTGSYGFLLPSENIVPTGQEIFNAMKYLGDFLLGNNGIEKLGGDDDAAQYSKITDAPPSEETDEDWVELRRRRRRR